MKRIKGEVGYLDYHKKKNLILFVSGLATFNILYLVGYFVYNTNKNMLTLISVLLILPTSQFVTKYILIARYKSGSLDMYNRLKQISGNLVILCDLLLVSGRNTRYFEFAVISGKDLVLLSNLNKFSKKDKKNNIRDDKTIIQDMLNSKGFKANIKIYEDSDEFYSYLLDTSLRNKSNDKKDELAQLLLSNSV
jgi:hypothetical protein